MNVIFKSERLDFVNISVDYVYDCLRMVNDPIIQDFISVERHVYDYDGEMEWIKSKIDSNAPIYSIIERNSGKFIGNIEFMNIENMVAEIGICISNEFQDKHYGTETLKRIIDYGFNDMGFNEIYLRVFSHNTRAIHCYKKLGFIEYDIVKNVKKSNGQDVDEIYMKVKK